MRKPDLTSRSLLSVAVLAAMGASMAAHAADYHLIASSFPKEMPDGTTVTMWGFALNGASCTAEPPATCAPQVPGPALQLPEGDNTLTIHLTNQLNVPVSVVIPGQRASMTPVMFTDGAGRQRVRSFTREASPGETVAYTWTGLQPGTYLYHSGTQPQVQVQMGLYGALMHDAAPDEAYTGQGYDHEAVLLYSEVDPALHDAVAGVNGNPPTYGTAAYPSTINYAPKYFLVNGDPYVAGSSLTIAAGNVGERTLLRFLNAGLKTHVPVLQGQHLDLIAEDGKPYPFARTQYSVMLPALKTMDAILTPTLAGSFALYDRRLDLTTGGFPDGGMMSFLTIGGSTTPAPTATDDSYAATEDAVLMVAAPGVLDNDGNSVPVSATLVTTTSNGSLNLAADGSFSYMPKPNFAGADGFTYRASSGSQSSTTANVVINVAPVNDPAVATGDAYNVVAGGSLTVPAPGVLSNDTDVDGDTLTAALASPATGGTVSLNSNGSFTYNAPLTGGTYSFSYRAHDGTVASNAATVSISVTANTRPVAVNDNTSTPKNAALTITVLANDYDPDTAADANNKIVPDTVRLGTTSQLTVRTQRGGTATVDTATGKVQYTPFLNFRGTDYFTYTVKDSMGATSNTAIVRINVL